MPTPILTTKLYRPPLRRDLVRRERLYLRLDRLLERKLGLVSAPAGYGKTTLVTGWIEHLRATRGDAAPAIAWVSLDVSDDDPRSFWSYLVAALRGVCGPVGELSLGALDVEPLPPMQPSLVALINELAACEGQALLVLDDYHLISDPRIHADLGFLIDHLPAGLQILIVARRDPPLDLDLLRIHGDLVELRQDALAFSGDETATLLDRALRQSVSAEEAQTLADRTEGWAAGIQLAGLSMAGRDETERAAFVAGFGGAHRRVSDFLLGQVYARQPTERQRFLLRTSILARLCGPLCDAVTGDGEGQETLMALERANLFLIPLDDERRWYRYHHLFQEFLQGQLNAQAEGRVGDLHASASAWFESEGLLEEAIDHALLAREGELAARLTAGLGRTLLDRAEYIRLVQAVERLPEGALLTQPRLAADYAAALIRGGRLSDAERVLDQVARGSPDDALVLARVLVHRGKLAELRGEQSAGLKLIEGALDLASEQGEAAYAQSTRAEALMVRASVLREQFRYEEAHVAATEALALFTELDSPSRIYGALHDLRQQEVNQARTRAAEELMRQADRLLARWREMGVAARAPLAFTTLQHHYWMNLLTLQGRLDEADAHRTPALEGLDALGGSAMRTWFHMCLADLACLQGRLGEAQRSLDLVDGAAMGARREQDWRLGYAAPTRLLLAEQASGRRELPAIQAEWLARNPLSPHWEREGTGWLALGHLWSLVWLGRNAEALAHLERFLATDIDRPVARLISRVLRTVALYQLGRERLAMEALREALDVCAEAGMVDRLILWGRCLMPLLLRALQEGRQPELVRCVLNAPINREAAPALPPANADLPEPLTEREMQVLRLLSAGLNATEIAAQLVIGVSTSRSHVRNIYGKLGAHSRAEVVSRAEELGLLNERL